MSQTLQPSEFFGVEARFLTSKEGGRNTALFPHAAGFAGYRPDFRISGSKAFHGCAFTSAPLQISPGDLVVGELLFWCCDQRHPDFVPGMEFELCEGPHRIAIGKLLLKGTKSYSNPNAKR
jgi:hypothetical protein